MNVSVRLKFCFVNPKVIAVFVACCQYRVFEVVAGLLLHCANHCKSGRCVGSGFFGNQPHDLKYMKIWGINLDAFLVFSVIS